MLNNKIIYIIIILLIILSVICKKYKEHYDENYKQVGSYDSDIPRWGTGPFVWNNPTRFYNSYLYPYSWYYPYYYPYYNPYYYGLW